ncbi:DUF3127 domain-containing protein [Saccharicrinis sp. FJH2]|uniref:DUF3127 domain-containing protein n=1 Tax=Saccharicrinis sp. FJH65 TaxID=3344659 RepID=UPI0035F47BD4
MNFEIEGNLILKENEQQISDKFKKREFVIEVENERNSDWNDFIKFQLTQDKCNLIDQYNNGDKIKVSFNIRGRKWEKNGQVNYFSNLEAWRIEGAMAQNSPVPADVPPPDLDNIPPENDDLPF